MYLPLGKFSPDVKLGMVSASRNCFPRSLSEERTKALLAACDKAGVSLVVPNGKSRIIESKEDAVEAALELRNAGCDAAVLYLGNFSPEIEDATFVKQFAGNVMMIAAAEESAATLAEKRGDALCGLLSAAMAVRKRGMLSRVYVPPVPLVTPESGVAAIRHFTRVMKVVKGIRNATIGLFGPRPRDFETCNYSVASLASIGIEVEELGFFDLANRIEDVREDGDLAGTEESIRKEIKGVPAGDFITRLAAYEDSIKYFRDSLKLSGIATQCWSEQELALKHVPCSINARMAAQGCPIACENDAYSLVAELFGQYASDASVTILDINHSIPKDLHKSLSKYPPEDLVGLFHCGNTDPCRMKNPEMKHQVIMKRLMEPDGEPDITRGTLEGAIAASPITVLQTRGTGNNLQAYIIQGEFLDLDPGTFGSTGTAYLPGFGRFYRHLMLGRFHHHAGVAFAHCGAVLYDAMKLLGVEEIHTPNAAGVPYEGENAFRWDLPC